MPMIESIELCYDLCITCSVSPLWHVTWNNVSQILDRQLSSSVISMSTYVAYVLFDVFSFDITIWIIKRI